MIVYNQIKIGGNIMKLTREEFEQMNQTQEEKEANYTSARNAICKKVFTWQSDTYVWDAQTLAEELPGYSISPSFVISRKYTPKGASSDIVVDVVFQQFPDTPDNSGDWGKYRLIEVQEGFWRIEKK